MTCGRFPWYRQEQRPRGRLRNCREERCTLEIALRGSGRADARLKAKADPSRFPPQRTQNRRALGTPASHPNARKTGARWGPRFGARDDSEECVRGWTWKKTRTPPFFNAQAPLALGRRVRHPSERQAAASGQREKPQVSRLRLKGSFGGRPELQQDRRAESRLEAGATKIVKAAIRLKLLAQLTRDTVTEARTLAPVIAAFSRSGDCRSSFCIARLPKPNKSFP